VSSFRGIRLICDDVAVCQFHEDGGSALEKCPGYCEEDGCKEEVCAFDDLLCEKHRTLELARKHLKIFFWSEISRGKTLAVAFSKEEAVELIVAQCNSSPTLREELSRSQPEEIRFKPFGIFTAGRV
jgi:hypothetical protein